MKVIPIEDVRRILKERGCTGLLLSGMCGCHVDDLVPCGEFGVEQDGDELPNGCIPGHLHRDPRPGKEREWGVFLSPEPPTTEQWERLDDTC